MLARHLLKPAWYLVLLFLAALTPAAPAIAQDAGPYDTLSCERRIEFWVTEVGLPPTRAANDVVAAPYLDRECKAGLTGSCACVRGLAARGMTPEFGEKLVRRELDPLCADGDGSACLRLYRLVGWYSTDDAVNRKSLVEAERGCRVDFAPACVVAGGLLIHLSATKDEHKRAAGMLERACDLDRFNPSPCILAAAALGALDKPFATRDAVRATSFLSRACERRDAESCLLVGDAYEDGTEVPVDLHRSRAMRERGCELESALACTDLSQMLHEGAGGPRDYRRAADLAKSSCEVGDMHACMALGGMYYYGKGVVMNRVVAFELAVTACDGGNHYGCNNAAAALLAGQGVRKDPARLYKYRYKGCSLGDRVACRLVAEDDRARARHNAASQVGGDATTPAETAPAKPPA